MRVHYTSPESANYLKRTAIVIIDEAPDSLGQTAEQIQAVSNYVGEPVIYTKNPHRQPLVPGDANSYLSQGYDRALYRLSQDIRQIYDAKYINRMVVLGYGMGGLGALSLAALRVLPNVRSVYAADALGWTSETLNLSGHRRPLTHTPGINSLLELTTEPKRQERTPVYLDFTADSSTPPNAISYLEQAIPNAAIERLAMDHQEFQERGLFWDHAKKAIRHLED